jgi:hypothetical protein
MSITEKCKMPTPVNHPVKVPVQTPRPAAPVVNSVVPVTPVVDVSVVVSSDPVQDGNVFILGPYTSYTEPMPVQPPTPGLRTVTFQNPATSPGAVTHLSIPPAVNSTDVLPLNVYVVYAESTSVPANPTPDDFLNGNFPFAVVAVNVFTVTFDLQVLGVTPSLTPYLVQIVLEFPSGTVVPTS